MSDTSFLVLDAGNSRIKWGVHEAGSWRANGFIATSNAASLGAALAAAPRATSAIASNVAGADVAKALAGLCSKLGIPLRVIRAEATQLGVTNGYKEASQLGSDRWAALIAAHHTGPGHKLVVTAGTALTIDALTGKGEFLGGLIVAGPALMRRALDHGTAALRLAEGSFHDFPGNTPDAITSGSIQACAGAVRRMQEAMTARGMAPDRVILSGGAAGEIAGHLPLRHDIHENLVLDGLALIARAG
ncbi:MAG: type III pantothenate kinase [Usitatibacter sp.]